VVGLILSLKIPLHIKYVATLPWRTHIAYKFIEVWQPKAALNINKHSHVYMCTDKIGLKLK